MALLDLATLLVKETKAAIYSKALSFAVALDLPVTSWQAGDPTRSLYHILSEILSTLEDVVASYIASGFLDYATGDWLTLLAKQVYNVDRIVATYATTTETLTNSGGGVYDFEPGDITVKSTLSGKTYRNTTGGHLGASSTLDITLVADEAGSDSSAGATEIDALVTSFLGVTCSNAAAAVGLDAESDDSLRQRCRDKLGALSPNGPKAAYSYVARNPDLTGTSGATRVRVFTVADTGDVTIYLAGPSGAVSEPDRAAVEAAIVEWATPQCITPTVLAASEVTVAVDYTIWIYQNVNLSDASVKAAIQTALETMFSVRPIGGDIIAPATTGKLYLTLLQTTIQRTFPNDTFRVSVSSPAGDTALANNEVAKLGAITATVNFVSDP